MSRVQGFALALGSVGLVSAAQAFHWFDTDAVRTEWKRILHPQGLALVFWTQLGVFSDIPGFAPSGDSLFFEMRKEK